MRLTSRRIVVFLPLLSVALIASMLLWPRPNPASANPLGGIASVSAGERHTCALMTTTDVRCWGHPYYGELGNGAITGVAQVSAGEDTTCALTAASTAECWGDNTDGQLGDGLAESFSTTPVVPLGLGTVDTVAAGAAHYACAIKSGALWCWGTVFPGGGAGSTPIAVASLTSGVAAMALGAGHVCVLMTTGTVKCLGNNGAGQLGDGTTDYHITPSDVLLGNTAVAIGAGFQLTCALLASGVVKCWGAGYGSVPVAVPGVTDANALSVGGFHGCALVASDVLKCWGGNIFGQLGDGQQCGLYCSTPVDVLGLPSGITSISAGFHHSCAVSSTNIAYCWGDDNYGELGDGNSTGIRTYPTAVVQSAPKLTPTPTPCAGACPTSTPTNTPSALTAPDFSLGVGSQCDSSGANKCFVGVGDTFTVKFWLRGLPPGLLYAGYDLHMTYSSGLSTTAASLVQLAPDVWPSCVFPVSDFLTNGAVTFACVYGINAPLSQYTGVLARLDFKCPGTPTVEAITLQHGDGITDVVDYELALHPESPTGGESLMINCGSAPPTATPTSPGPVGGISVEPGASGSLQAASRSDTRMLTGISAGAATAMIVLIGGVWYAWRRRAT